VPPSWPTWSRLQRQRPGPDVEAFLAMADAQNWIDWNAD
jgi:hypothetical protein